MTGRLLVLKAGSGASNNLIRAIKAGDRSITVLGCHDDRFVLKKSIADRNYLMPRAGDADYLGALRRIIKLEAIQLVIPNSEADVTTVAQLRERLPCRTFLPRSEFITLCQDKYALAVFLRRKGIPVPRTYAVMHLDEVGKLFGRFRGGSVLWCRLRKGTGSLGAIPVRSPGQVRSWVRYWQDMHGIAAGSFTLAEYLPGRDFCVQCLWKDGKPVMTKMHERLSYYVAGGGPSNVSSTAAFARTVLVPQIVRVCHKAVRAIDPRASGVFFLDLKEREDGIACITEINAGRFANVPTIHDQTGKPNMALAYVRLALGERIQIRQTQENAEEYYVLRDLDTAPAVFPVGQVAHGIRDARRFRDGTRAAP
jgi:glutathione synthase/RimK-type ligase-like ATP-grasp enzyme